MKLLLIVLLLQNVSCKNCNETFNKWKKDFDVKYQSKYDESVAIKQFCKNLKVINNHNEKFHRGEVSYEMGLWEESDQSTEITSLRYNRHEFVENSKADSRTLHSVQKGISVNIASLNWMDEGYVNDVPYQGRCGSCWAFAAIGVLEGQVFKKSGKLPKLSVQQLIDCSKVSPWSTNGCKNGVVRSAFNYINSVGVASEFSYPYQALDTFRCSLNKSMTLTKCNAFKTVSGNENNLKAVLSKVGPLSIIIDASRPSFIHYKSGIYNDPKCTKNLNHAMLLIGYGTDKIHGDYWLIRNQYSKSWGQEGLFKLARNANNTCGILNYVTYCTL